MSGIAGIYHLDGRPVNPVLLRRMTDVIAHRGPDGCDSWTDGPVGLGHRMLHTTPESLQETQPLVDGSRNLCLTFDGRVDNRDELKIALEAKGVRLGTDTDAEIVLRAYECWGEECPKRILGDFAFVIWDKRSRQLFCARDPLGIKPFYYHTDGRTFICASELHQLFEDPTVRREPNEGMIGEYLAAAIIDREETLYRGILRLPPAHSLIIRPDGVRKERYWDIDRAREIRYRTDVEYSEHFSEIFKEAVRCRLRSCGPIAAELSGGLDSSSVVGRTQSLYRDGVLADGGFETFSLVYPGLPCDESRYIQDVVRMWGLKSNAVCPEGSNVSWVPEQIRFYKDFPDYPNGAMFYPLKATLREKGFRVLLRGLGGDDWLEGSYFQYADLLRNLKFVTFLRQACCSTSPSALLVLRFGVWPLIPVIVRRSIRSTLKRNGIPFWINKYFARCNSLNERLRKETEQRTFLSLSQWDLYRSLNGGWQSHILEVEDRSASAFGLEGRHPLNDRRLLEFALAIPEEQRWRGNRTKFVLRQAMGGLLPETVRHRLTKADFSHAFANALKALGGERLFVSLAIESMGWVNGDEVRQMYRQMAQLYAQGHEKYINHTWPLWMILGIETWFKTVFLKKDIFVPEWFGIQKGNGHALALLHS